MRIDYIELNGGNNNLVQEYVGSSKLLQLLKVTIVDLSECPKPSFPIVYA